MDEKKCSKCQHFGYCYEDYCKIENESKSMIYNNYIYKKLFTDDSVVIKNKTA